MTIDSFIDSVKASTYDQDTIAFSKRLTEQESAHILAKIGISPALIHQRVEKSPYKLAIENLKSIETHVSPLDKLRVIGKSNQMISSCINEFWDRVTYFPPEKLQKKVSLPLTMFNLVDFDC